MHNSYLHTNVRIYEVIISKGQEIKFWIKPYPKLVLEKKYYSSLILKNIEENFPQIKTLSLNFEDTRATV